LLCKFRFRVAVTVVRLVLIERLARFMRHLAANGTIRETNVDTYASTRLSASFRQKSFKDAIRFM
jgi:hypothetical protein